MSTPRTIHRAIKKMRKLAGVRPRRPRGIIIKGNIPNEQLEAFRAQWYAMTRGIGNAWHVPFTRSP